MAFFHLFAFLTIFTKYPKLPKLGHTPKMAKIRISWKMAFLRGSPKMAKIRIYPKIPKIPKIAKIEVFGKYPKNGDFWHGDGDDPFGHLMLKELWNKLLGVLYIFFMTYIFPLNFSLFHKLLNFSPFHI